MRPAAIAPGTASRIALSTTSITRIETVSAARAVRTALRDVEAGAAYAGEGEQVAEEEGQHDRQRDARDVAPAPPGGEHHAQHLADRTAGQAVEGRGDRGAPGSSMTPDHIPPRGIWSSEVRHLCLQLVA